MNILFGQKMLKLKFIENKWFSFDPNSYWLNSELNLVTAQPYVISCFFVFFMQNSQLLPLDVKV